MRGIAVHYRVTAEDDPTGPAEVACDFDPDETLPQERAKTARFCSMKITEDVRKYAAEQGVAEEQALQAGMEQKAREFMEKGAELYAKT